MAASMMMAPVGSRWKVSGMSKAVPAAGPSPGRMPTIVPKREPAKAKRRFVGVRATENPIIRLLKVSMGRPSCEASAFSGQLSPSGTRAESLLRSPFADC